MREAKPLSNSPFNISFKGVQDYLLYQYPIIAHESGFAFLKLSYRFLSCYLARSRTRFTSVRTATPVAPLVR